MSTPTPGTVILFSPNLHTPLIPYLAALHASCITHDRLIATFLPPLSHEKLLAWWKERIAEVVAGTRLMWILIKDSASSSSEQASEEVNPQEKDVKGPDVVGVVMLAMPVTETGHFRASVERLLIHKDWRRRGGARKMLQALEEEARERGRTMLTLDTETESDADYLYKKVGYICLGRIPKYGLSPTGERKMCTFYYKQLEEKA